MDYNKLMAELDKEVSSSFESVGLSKGYSATEGYDEVERELLEGLDEKSPIVEVEGEEDLVFEDGEDKAPEGPEESPKDIFIKSVNDYFNSLVEDGVESDEAADEVLEVVDSVLPKEEDSPEEESAEEDLGSWLAARRLRNMNRKGISADASDEEKAAFKDKQERLKLRARAGAVKGNEEKGTKSNATQRVLDEVKKEGQQRNAQRTNEIKANKKKEALRADIMSKLGVTGLDQLKELLGRAGFSSTEGVEEVVANEEFDENSSLRYEVRFDEDAQNLNEVFEDKGQAIDYANRYLAEGPVVLQIDLEDGSEEIIWSNSEAVDTARAEESQTGESDKAVEPKKEVNSFEEYQKEKEAKMLNRYKQLANKDVDKKKVAIEGLGEAEISIDDRAISRVSGEYGYSGKNLRKMVAEAIQRGDI